MSSSGIHKKLGAKESKLSRDEVATKIQVWFRGLPFRRRAIRILNAHNAEMKLGEIDREQRKEFVKEVKNGQYDKILKRQNATALALSALKANQISYIEAATIIEIGQHDSKAKIQFCKFLDDKKELTEEGKSYLKKLYQLLKEGHEGGREIPKPLPEQFADENGYQLFETNFINNIRLAIQKHGASANLFYVVDDPTFDPSQYDFHSVFASFHIPPEVDSENPRFIAPAFHVADVIGTVLYGKNWALLEYRLGDITNKDIELGQRYNTRVVSISSPEVGLPKEVHDMPVSAHGFTRHDKGHRFFLSLIPVDFRPVFVRLIDLARETVSFEWTKELFRMVDLHINQVPSNVSSEKRFFMIAQQIPGLDVETRNAGDVSELEEGQLVFDKNGTSVVLWLMVMDMGDRPDLWKNRFNFDVKSADNYYDHHRALYLSLKDNPEFSKLDPKQKLYVLDKAYHLFDEERKPYERNPDYTSAWARFNEKFTIPPAKDLTFKKVKKGEERRFFKANQVYLGASEEKKDSPKTEVKKSHS